MARTLIARLEQQHQYDEAAATINWQDGTIKRWTDIYGLLGTGDTAIFLSDGHLLVGNFDSAVQGQSVIFNNVRKTLLKNDDCLRISAISPEIVSRIKANFPPFISPVQIDVNAVFNSAIGQQFVSFYVVRQGKTALVKPPLKNNDRVIEINNQGKITEIYLFDGGVYRPANFGNGYFNVRNRTLQEILTFHQAAKKDSAKRTPNNVKSVEAIIDTLSKSDFYKFRTFGEYYNIIHNKKLYLGIPAPEEGEDDPIDLKERKNQFNMPLNQILYGPPGTGKTFHSISHAVAIVDGRNEEEVLSQREKEAKNNEEGPDTVIGRFREHVTDGKIKLCTFHQSLSYEDFIEGIKPIEPKEGDAYLKYKTEPGIFKDFCTQIFNSEKLTDSVGEQVVGIMDFNQLYAAFLKKIAEILSNLAENELYEIPSKRSRVRILKIQNDNIVTRGKTASQDETVEKEMIKKIYDLFGSPSYIKNVNRDIRAVDSAMSWTTNYYAVFRALKDFEENYKYSSATKTKAEPKKYVFIIDEINRGNVSQIFGELITLIEEDKRHGKPEALTVTLPYSRDEFSVPSNLYIIGTMNTADRSVEALDTALRRRFTFVPMMPEETKLSPTADGIELVKMLEAINDRLRILKDNDHTIGHAWLMGVKNIGELRIAFGNKILPLLQEYFYNDHEKLGLVLGNEFYANNEVIKKGVFAKFADSKVLVGQYSKARQYELKQASKLTIENFQSLYGPNEVVPDAE